MYIRKLYGTSDGFLLEIGEVTFAVMYVGTWDTKLQVSHEIDGEQDVQLAWWGAQEFALYAFKQKGADWVISENPNGKYGRSQGTGLMLNAINRDKKVRIGRDEFIALVEPLYREALQREASTFKCKF